MEKLMFKEKYPIFRIEIEKSKSGFKRADDLLETLKKSIEEHPVAVYIGVFDHYAHTSSLSEGEIGEGIAEAKNIIFCFGKELLVPEVLAVRPRSIGICDLDDRFVVTFMEAPNPQANEAMKGWVEALSGRAKE